MAPRSDLSRQEKSPTKAQSIPGKQLKPDPQTRAICLDPEWCFRSQRLPLRPASNPRCYPALNI